VARAQPPPLRRRPRHGRPKHGRREDTLDLAGRDEVEEHFAQQRIHDARITLNAFHSALARPVCGEAGRGAALASGLPIAATDADASGRPPPKTAAVCASFCTCAT
jgi:hypothetical protein